MGSAANTGPQQQNTITAVLVLYQRAASESETFRSLSYALTQLSSMRERLSVILYDNSPTGYPPPTLSVPLLYQSDTTNGGVAAAYNYGLAEARRNGSSWLLLLDQDTTLTLDYLAELQAVVEMVSSRVAAIVPRLVQNGHTHSPHLPPRLSHRAIPPADAGLLPYRVTAFNSGAAIRVRCLETFPPGFWLDFLDHALFHQLQSEGGHIWLLNSALQHQLSTTRLGTEASLDRYRNVLRAEREFYARFGSTSDRIWYHLRRAKQALGHLAKVPDKRFAVLSARAALGMLGRD